MSRPRSLLQEVRRALPDRWRLAHVFLLVNFTWQFAHSFLSISLGGWAILASAIVFWLTFFLYNVFFE